MAGRDRARFVLARGIRGFGAGALGVVFALDLEQAGYSPFLTGLLVGLAMAAGAAWALGAHRIERRVGRRQLLVVGAVLFAAGGALLWANLHQTWVVLLALLLGAIVAGTSDISPLGAAEQAGLAAATDAEARTSRFAWYNLAGYLGAAAGAVVAVPLSSGTWGAGWTGLRDPTLLLYGLLGVALVPIYLGLSGEVEAGARLEAAPLGAASRRSVLELSGLFAVDAFGGGLIVNSLVSAFLVERFHPSLSSIGWVLFGGNVAAAVSLLLAAPIAARIGLVRTMVFTHLPSDVLLATAAFAPSVLFFGVLWVARSTLSQMDVPTRQAFVQAIVRPEERTAAAGYTTAARSGQALGAPATGALLGAGGALLGAPFVLAGAVKVAYDVALFARFRTLEPVTPPQ